MIVEAFNSAIVEVGADIALNVDFDSAIIDFRDSAYGSIQVFWSGAVGFGTGEFMIHGSLERDPATLDDNDVEHSDYIITKAAGSHLYTYEHLCFRYAQLRWVANGVTAGTFRIKAMGKRS